MKIYNKIVIQDGKVIEEDSYEYEGPVALCMGRRSKPAPPPPPPPPPPPVEDIREEVREEIEAKEREDLQVLTVFIEKLEERINKLETKN